jgi:hypothetical protein
MVQIYRLLRVFYAFCYALKYDNNFVAAVRLMRCSFEWFCCVMAMWVSSVG